MIVRLRNKLYQTDFTIEDLLLFEKMGSWSKQIEYEDCLATKINNGARYCKEHRHTTDHHHGGSDCALVEVEPVDYVVETRSK